MSDNPAQPGHLIGIIEDAMRQIEAANGPAVEADGWHDFTLEQAREFLDAMKRQHPGRWTGLGRIAEQMTAECVKLRAEVARLRRILETETLAQVTRADGVAEQEIDRLKTVLRAVNNLVRLDDWPSLKTDVEAVLVGG